MLMRATCHAYTTPSLSARWPSCPTPRRAGPERRPRAHPFTQYVNPHLADLLATLRLDKRFVRGEGSDLFDHAGCRYLDCIAAYGALPFGYNPPVIWRALQGLRARGEPSFVQPSLLDAAGQLAERLVEIAPEGLCRVTFANSGAEAVEAAIKLCRAATGRLGILSTQGSFHGKTLGALSATGNPDYQNGFGAPATDFDQVPFGDVGARCAGPWPIGRGTMQPSSSSRSRARAASWSRPPATSPRSA